jgi:hypothetical protein
MQMILPLSPRHQGGGQWLGLKRNRVAEVQEMESCGGVIGEMLGLEIEWRGKRDFGWGRGSRLGGWVKKSLFHWVKIHDRMFRRRIC